MARISNAALLPAYLVVGSDELKVEKTVCRLKSRLDEGLATFNLDELKASADLLPGTLTASLNTIPVGTGFRLVVVHDAEKLPKPTSEAIISYLKDPNEGCVLLLVAKTLAKTTRLYKAVKACGDKSVIDCFPPKKRWELPGQVCKLARAHGLQMDEAAATELISRVGESTVMLDAQLKSLAALFGDGACIGVPEVEKNVARIADVKPWDLLDAVSARDAQKALRLYRMMRKPSQIALVTFLSGRIRELICAKSLDARGEGGMLPGELKKQQWQVKNYVGWARRFAPGELESALSSLARCEADLKSGADAETTFVMLMLELCGV